MKRFGNGRVSQISTVINDVESDAIPAARSYHEKASDSIETTRLHLDDRCANRII